MRTGKWRRKYDDSMVSPHNILISNCYSYKNKGDAAIVTCLIKELQSQFPNAEIAVSCHDEDDIKNKVYGDRPYYPNIQKVIFGCCASTGTKAIRSAWFLFRIWLFELINMCNIRAFWLFSGKSAEKIRSYEAFDAVVACGGGYLVSRGKTDIIGNIVFAYDFFLAHIFRKPFVLYNQSIGPFGSRLHIHMLRRYIKDARLIICREDYTYQRLKIIGLRNIALGSDIAFLLRPKKTNILKKCGFSAKERNIGITVRYWLRKENQKSYELQISRLIEKIIEDDTSTKIYFMPQVVYEANDDNDINVARRIYNLLPKKAQARVHIIKDDIEPSELLYAIGKMNFFIGTRMHSNLFAILSGVKTIAIGYEPKTRGIMEMMGLERYSIEMQDLTSEKLLDLFGMLQKDKIYLGTLRKSLFKMRKLARTDLRSVLS